MDGDVPVHVLLRVRYSDATSQSRSSMVMSISSAATLIEQLRAGYGSSASKGSIGLAGAMPGSHPHREATFAKRSRRGSPASSSSWFQSTLALLSP